MFRTSFRIAAFTVALNLAACVPPEQEPPLEDDQSYVASNALSQEIGPEGGELVGPEDGPLAGVKLRIPAGALAAKTTITLDTINDEKGLEGSAERVGPQFSVDAAGASFAAPVSLTVPIDAQTLSKFGQGHADCKVWFRTNGDWTRLERTASAEGSVTVDVPSPGVAAAGVISASRSLACLTQPSRCLTGSPLIPKNQLCTSPTGYCIVKLPRTPYVPDETRPNFNIVGRKLYYVHRPATNQVSVVRYDLDSGAAVILGTVNTSDRPEAHPVAVEADGSAWVAMNDFGNVKFKENTPPFRFDFETTANPRREGNAVVVTGGKTLRFFRDGTTGDHMMTDGATIKAVPTLEQRPANYGLQPHHKVPGGVIGVYITDFVSFGFDSTSATEVFQSNAYLDGAASFVNTGIATLIRNPDEIRWKTANGSEQRIGVPAEQTLLAFDGSDLVYVASTRAPELSIANAQGGLAVLPLTDAAEGTAEYRAMEPRALVGVPGRAEVLVYNNGTINPRQRDFYLVRKANN